MKSKLIFIIPLLLTWMISVILYYGVDVSNKKSTYKGLINQTLPQINLDSMGSTEQFLPTLRKEKYVIHVFASWCRSCLGFHKMLSKVNENKKYTIYGIALKDQESNLEKMFEYLGNPYVNVAIDSLGYTAIELGVKTIPESIFVKNDIIVARYPGGASLEELEKFYAD